MLQPRMAFGCVFSRARTIILSRQQGISIAIAPWMDTEIIHWRFSVRFFFFVYASMLNVFGRNGRANVTWAWARDNENCIVDKIRRDSIVLNTYYI